MGATSTDSIKEFARLLADKRKAGEKIQTAWVKVKDVDWNEKTMTAIGVVDNLEFYDVLLGVGFVFLKPKKETKCLIGLIENQEASAFLIDAEEVDEAEFKFGKIKVSCTDIVFNDGNNKGLAKVDSIAQRLNQLEAALTEIKTIYSSHTHVSTAPSTNTSLPSSPLTYSVPNSTGSDFENTDIKH